MLESFFSRAYETKVDMIAPPPGQYAQKKAEERSPDNRTD